MTDEQIIKALECCATDDGDYCSQCPYGNIDYKPGNGGCVNRCRKDALDLINRQKEEIEMLLQKLQQAKSETIKLPYKVTAEVYSVLDREEFPKGVYKCEVSAYLVDDGELYSLLTVTVGDRTVVGIKTDIENMYATREEAEAALREKESEEWEEK